MITMSSLSWQTVMVVRCVASESSREPRALQTNKWPNCNARTYNTTQHKFAVRPSSSSAAAEESQKPLTSARSGSSTTTSLDQREILKPSLSRSSLKIVAQRSLRSLCLYVYVCRELLLHPVVFSQFSPVECAKSHSSSSSTVAAAYVIGLLGLSSRAFCAGH